MVSCYFFFVFDDESQLGILAVVTTGLRERQRASVEVERVVESQSRLKKWSIRKRDLVEVGEREGEKEFYYNSNLGS